MNAVLALKPTVRKLKFQVMFPPLKIFVKNMNIIAQCIPCVTKVITRVSHPNEIREHFASKILCFQFINAIKSISQGRIILLIGFSWPNIPVVANLRERAAHYIRQKCLNMEYICYHMVQILALSVPSQTVEFHSGTSIPKMEVVWNPYKLAQTL